MIINTTKNPIDNSSRRIQNGKGSNPRPVKGDVYRERFEEIFGGGKKEEEKPVDVVETLIEEQPAEKTLCPHCATMNLIQETPWILKCLRCGYEKK